MYCSTEGEGVGLCYPLGHRDLADPAVAAVSSSPSDYNRRIGIGGHWERIAAVSAKDSDRTATGQCLEGFSPRERRRAGDMHDHSPPRLGGCSRFQPSYRSHPAPPWIWIDLLAVHGNQPCPYPRVTPQDSPARGAVVNYHRRRVKPPVPPKHGFLSLSLPHSPFPVPPHSRKK